MHHPSSKDWTRRHWKTIWEEVKTWEYIPIGLMLFQEWDNNIFLHTSCGCIGQYNRLEPHREEVHDREVAYCDEEVR